jgi:hypothetical protein
MPLVKDIVEAEGSIIALVVAGLNEVISSQEEMEALLEGTFLFLCIY